MFTVTNYAGFSAGQQKAGQPPSTPGLLTWYDFSDATTVNTTSTDLRGVTDKSTSGFNATNTDLVANNQVPVWTGSAIQNGHAAALFSAGTQSAGGNMPRLVSTNTFLGTGTAVAFSYAAVAARTGSSTWVSQAFLFNLVHGTVGDMNSLQINGGDARLDWGLGGEFAVTTGGISPVHGWHIFSGRAILGTASVSVDGGVLTATKNTTATITVSANWLVVGNQGVNPSVSNPDTMDGYIGEVRLFNTFLGTSDLAKEEGYLAWKWGLQGNLPAGHPYKNSPP